MIFHFHHLQKRFAVQCEGESYKTFELFPHEDMDVLIYRAKADEAVARACMCGMVFLRDKDVLQDIVHVIETAVTDDGEDEEYNQVIEPPDETNSSEELPVLSITIIIIIFFKLLIVYDFILIFRFLLLVFIYLFILFFPVICPSMIRSFVTSPSYPKVS